MKTKLLFLLASLFCTCTIWGQGQTIKGKVTSPTDNEPIIGASVMVKGTVNGTITNIDGNFQLSANTNATLVKTKAVKLEVHLPDKYSSGLFEWEVK